MDHKMLTNGELVDLAHHMLSSCRSELVPPDPKVSHRLGPFKSSSPIPSSTLTLLEPPREHGMACMAFSSSAPPDSPSPSCRPPSVCLAVQRPSSRTRTHTFLLRYVTPLDPGDDRTRCRGARSRAFQNKRGLCYEDNEKKLLMLVHNREEARYD